jgi:hypothetical protein
VGVCLFCSKRKQKRKWTESKESSPSAEKKGHRLIIGRIKEIYKVDKHIVNDIAV